MNIEHWLCLSLGCMIGAMLQMKWDRRQPNHQDIIDATQHGEQVGLGDDDVRVMLKSGQGGIFRIVIVAQHENKRKQRIFFATNPRVYRDEHFSSQWWIYDCWLERCGLSIDFLGGEEKHCIGLGESFRVSPRLAEVLGIDVIHLRQAATKLL